jgi:hypothetical protein
MEVSARKGDRVGAVLSFDPQGSTISVLGSGEFLGIERVPGRGDFQVKIKLDTGRIVWGHEIFAWGQEDTIRRNIRAWENDGWKIQLVDLDDAGLPFSVEPQNTLSQAI